MSDTNYLSANPVVVEYVNGQPDDSTTDSQLQAQAQEANQQVAEGQAPAPGTETDPSKENAETKPDPEQEKFASRFAALSRKEKELIQRERAFKEQQAQLQAWEKAKAEAKKNPLQLLKSAGFNNLEDALSVIINEGQEPTEQDRLRGIEEKIAAYEQQQRELAVRAQEFRKQQELAQIQSNISTYVNENLDQFELVHAYNAIPDVWSVIERAYIETNGRVHLTVEQACQAVEEQLLEEKKQEAERIAKSKKLSKLLSLATDGNVEDSKSKEGSKKVSPTLTNHAATVQAAPPKKYKTREESLAAAAKLLKWKDE